MSPQKSLQDLMIKTSVSFTKSRLIQEGAHCLAGLLGTELGWKNSLLRVWKCPNGGLKNAPHLSRFTVNTVLHGKVPEKSTKAPPKFLTGFFGTQEISGMQMERHLLNRCQSCCPLDENYVDSQRRHWHLDLACPGSKNHGTNYSPENEDDI